jgi:autoinducer 2 (AI-2) kinase
MVFENGAVKAGMGAPPGKADLTLKMKAEIFDGMMTGKINAMSAAMSGKMKFSGDTGKAMQMQRIQKDIMRLYSEARQKIGDPGDLSKLGPAPAAASVSAASAAPAVGAPLSQPQAAPSYARPAIHTGDERDELVAAVQELYEKNLITATGGNLSIRVAGRENELWITPSAMFKGSLHPEMMVRINMEGEALDEEAATPSSERWVHTEILKARPDLNVVIHTHAPWSTLLALSETPFLPISTEAAFIGDIPRVPFIMPGTRELAMAVARAMGEKGAVVLMQNHGLVVAGSSLRRAASTTEVVERYSELILRCLTLGKQPPVLPEEAVKSLREMGQMMA